MSGTAEIKDNNATTSGGGVFVNNGTTFTMDGGTLQSNKAQYGGGVIVYGGSFYMSGGIIYGSSAGLNSNTATMGVGASLYVFSGTAQYSGAYGGGTISTTNNTLP
jgi:hypothetical protein